MGNPVSKVGFASGKLDCSVAELVFLIAVRGFGRSAGVGMSCLVVVRCSIVAYRILRLKLRAATRLRCDSA